MADRVPDRRHRTTAGVRLRLFARLVGLAGLLAAPVGAGLMFARGEAVPPAPSPNFAGVSDWLAAFARQATTDPGAGLLAGGVLAVLVWLLVEVAGVLFTSTGRRSARGANAVAQVALAVALVVIVNGLSFTRFERVDLTRDQRFTLPPDLVAELKALRADSPTTVVVVPSDRVGPFAGKPDAYDRAAEAVTVEKVQDLVAQLREFGPQFRVEVFDRASKDFDRTLAAFCARRPGLLTAVNDAPESSLFFYADDKVRTYPKADADRLLVAAGSKPSVSPDPDDATKSLVYPAGVARMGFSEFLQLDKEASRAAPDGGNLVLLPRGPAAFVRRVLTIDERRPRVGLAVIHSYLTSKDPTEDNFTATGLRAALERNGFDVEDVILKKWGRGAPTPDALTYEETELERAEARYNLLASATAGREQGVAVLSEVLARADKALAQADALPEAERGKPLVEAARALAPVVSGGRFRSEADVRRVRALVAEQVQLLKDDVKELTPRTAEASVKYQDRLRNERAVEGRRVTDIRAKFAGAVNDCDVLIVPRLTVYDLASGGVIRTDLHDLSADQAAVVREFLDAGKPVLFAVGPPVDPGRPGGGAGADDIERLLHQLGVRPGRQTILTDEETTAIAEQQGQLFGSAAVKQPVNFDKPAPEGKAPNPVAEALRVTGRSTGGALSIRQGAFRAVFASDALRARSPFAPEFLFTDPNSFNESRPIAEDDYLPKYEPARLDDPRRGTPEEERRASFPVGLAAEVPVPATWAAPPGVTAGDTPLGAVVGAGVPSVNKATPAGVAAAAALAARFDGGVLAAAATVAASVTPPPKTVRVVVVGHGGLFAGKTLDPGPETLLVSSLNWQLGRTNKLAAAPPDVWTYPRAHLTRTDATLWQFGGLLFLPALVAAAGAAVLTLRQLR